jgi:hypothetical protein
VRGLGARLRERARERDRNDEKGERGRVPKRGSARWQAPCENGDIIMIETIALATPVLAAGRSLLYLLFGGGIFGALVIFFGLKALGH